jgi:hypothetical protein
MEDDLKKNKNGRRPQKKMEDNLKKKDNIKRKMEDDPPKNNEKQPKILF